MKLIAMIKNIYFTYCPIPIIIAKQQYVMIRFGCFGCSKAFGCYCKWPLHLTKHVHANVP